MGWGGVGVKTIVVSCDVEWGVTCMHESCLANGRRVLGITRSVRYSFLLLFLSFGSGTKNTSSCRFPVVYGSTSPLMCASLCSLVLIHFYPTCNRCDNVVRNVAFGVDVVHRSALHAVMR